MLEIFFEPLAKPSPGGFVIIDGRKPDSAVPVNASTKFDTVA